MKMKVAKNFSGIALRCAADGVVQEVISDSLGAERCVNAGEPFANLVDAASKVKAESFLTTLRERQAAFGWEMNVACRGGITPVHFAGAAAAVEGGGADDFFFIVGAKSRDGVSRFYTDLMRVNNEQTNALRTALKDLSLQLRRETERDSHLYDELSRLNNELATTQRELAKKNVELARLNEQKNQFLGIAAHDLRNPLEVILTYSEFLLEDAAKFDAEQLAFIRKISSSSEFMLNLVNDFLDFAKIEAGRLDLALTAVDLPEFLRRVAERNRLAAGKKRLELILTLPDAPLPEISFDETKIEQVLNNLIGNALKFSSPGGTVELGAEAAAGGIILSVSDDGPGIAAQDAETLFRPFVKGTAAPTGGEKSTGLGLAIVKRIVEAHGGEITLESAPGAGTIFRLWLPREAAKYLK